VVLATLHGAGGFQTKDELFDAVIIDEASQALEAQCWVPLLRASKVVLAGDHLQLPPTIKSLNSKATKAKMKDSEGLINGMTLETTLFDRLLRLHGPGIKRMLTTQYRMHENIMRFPSDELYESKLVAADAVKARLLKDLPYEVKETEDTTEPLIFFDTQGGDFPEKNEEEEVDKKAGRGMIGESKSNEMEAALVSFFTSRSTTYTLSYWNIPQLLEQVTFESIWKKCANSAALGIGEAACAQSSRRWCKTRGHCSYHTI
jgi:DNA polymerase alpha-associated DNA helicase A